MEKEAFGEEKEQDYVSICRQEQMKLFPALPQISNPQWAALEIMQSAMRVYQADWCGVIDVDSATNTCSLYWWIEGKIGETDPAKFQSPEIKGLMDRWMEALAAMKPVVVVDLENDSADSENNPNNDPNNAQKNNLEDDSKACYQNLAVHSVIGCPFRNNEVTGFLVIRNAGRFATETSYLSILSYLITPKIAEQKTMDSLNTVLEAPETLADNEVRIHIFGGIRIETKTHVLQEKDLNSPGSWNILVYMLMHRERSCTTQELSEIDCRTVSAEDTRKSVRQKINRFNQKFRQISSYNLIVREDSQSKEAKYRINPELKIWMDFENYDDLMKQYRRTTSKQSQLELVKRAIHLYKGTAYPSQEYADWFVRIAAYYRRLNLENFETLTKHLDSNRRFHELLDYSMLIYQTMPQDIEGYYWMVYCLKKMHREEDAEKVMREARKRFDQEEWEELEDRLDTK